MTTAASLVDQFPRRRVLLVDDHPVVRAGLAKLINGESDLVLCGEADNVHQAIEAVYTLKPDLAIMDLSLKESSGFDLIKILKGRACTVPILVMSMHDEKIFAERVLRTGALGYIMKQATMEEILIAIRRVLEGEVYVGKQVVTQLMQSRSQRRKGTTDSSLDSLSDRELEVFQLIGQGFRRRHIAEILHLSVKTVETHRAHIMRKLHLANAMELNRFAMQWSTGFDTACDVNQHATCRQTSENAP
jgi:DNA-binding NarL/FixJ family response regulator